MRTNKKLIIIINGKGGCGKDTLIKMFERFYSTINCNSVEPYKRIVKKYGRYDENNKDDKYRKLISDLKRSFEEAGIDLSIEYTTNELRGFLDDKDCDVMFVHIREGKNIDKFIKYANLCINDKYTELSSERPYIATLLIKRKDTDEKTYGNSSDDDVENYKYDLVYENSKPENIAGYDFMIFTEENILPLLK